MSNIRITGDGPKITATGSGSTVLVEISTGQHDPGSFSGVHNDLTGRSTTGAHVGTAVSIDPTGFNNNLDGTITNAQLLAAAVDDLTTGGGGGGAVDSVDGRTGVVTLDDLYQTVGVEIATVDTTLAGPPRTVITAIVDGTVTLPTAGVGDVGQHWHISTGPYELTVVGCDGGDVTVPVGMVLSVVGFEGPGPVYGWAQLGFKTIDAPTSGGGADLSDTAPQDLGTAAAGASSEASRADHVHDMPTAADITVDASGFNGNLTTSDDTVQEIAQKLDDLVIPAAGIADPGGANDDFLQRKSGAWTNRTVAQVKTDLGVAEPSYYVDNEFYLLSHTNDKLGGSTAVTPGTNAMAFWLLIVERTIQVDGLWFYLQATGTGAKMRFGIWAASTTTGKPTGNPLVSAAEVDVSASTGYKSQTFTPVTLTPGTYWGGVAALGAATYRTWAAGSGAPPVDMGGPDSATTVHWSFNSPWTYNSGALPDVSGFTFTGQSGTIPPATGAPYVRWRVQIP